MTRSLPTQARCAATLVLAIGAALPVAADIGPAINPSIYAVPPGAKTVNVDCDARQTLAAALADKSGADLNIVFSGTCKEYLYLQRDGVALRGKDASATLAGALEITASRRVLLENFTCRDNEQLEYCIGALAGSSVTLHNIKVFNSSIRGVLVFNSTAIIEGLTVDKTASTSILVRGSDVRLEGDLTFSHTIEGCMVVDGASSVFSKSGVFSARDCGAGLVVQNNSAMQAPFATFNLNHNAVAGLMVLTHGTFSYGGTFSAKNNLQAGIYLDDASSFAPFTNIQSGSTVTLENNGNAGVYVAGGSLAELANVTANSGSNFGVLADAGIVRVRYAKISDNKTADLRLVFGSRVLIGDGATFGSVTCDGTQLMRGTTTACTVDTKPAAKPAEAAKAGAGKAGAR